MRRKFSLPAVRQAIGVRPYIRLSGVLPRREMDRVARFVTVSELPPHRSYWVSDMLGPDARRRCWVDGLDDVGDGRYMLLQDVPAMHPHDVRWENFMNVRRVRTGPVGR